MRKVLLFPAGESRFKSILEERYQIVPINNYTDLQDYISIAEVLVLDSTRNSRQAMDFLKDIPQKKDLGIVAYVGKDALLEEKFLKLGVSILIKDEYSTDTINSLIDQIVSSMKSRRELMALKTSGDSIGGFSAFSGFTPDSAQNMFIQPIQQREILKNFSQIFSAGNNLKNLLDIFLGVIQEMLKVSRIAVFLDEKGSYKIKAHRGLSVKMADYVSLSSDGPLVEYMKKQGTILRLETLKGIDPQLYMDMSSLGVVVMIPLWEQGRLIGIIAFNNKITGMPVNEGEIELIFSLGSQMAKAIENTSLVELTSSQRDYLEGILQHVSSGVLTINMENIVETFNPKAEEILGIKREEILGRHISLLPGNMAESLEETINTGQPYFRKELKLFQLEKIIGGSITPIKTSQGNIIGSVMIFTDITPIKALEEENRRLDRLDFTSTIAMRSSHELKNCLVSIKTFAQLLPERYMDKQFREDFYLVVNKEVDRLNQLVENLLFFAQPLKLEFLPNNIEDLISETIDMLEKKGLLQNIEIMKEYGHRSTNVDIDKEVMMRALKAVFYNSIQAMPKGGRIHIVTEDVTEQDKEFMQVKIIDEGAGIDMESIDKVWDPFFTTKTRGIGLGLTIVRKIITEHGGKIGIQSHPGEGTELNICLSRRALKKESNAIYFPSGRRVMV